MSAWAIYRRHVLAQVLILVSGWASLHYGWGMDVKSWPVIVAYLVAVSAGYPLLALWARGQVAK